MPAPARALRELSRAGRHASRRRRSPPHPADGEVWAAKDPDDHSAAGGGKVAIKKINNAFCQATEAKRILRGLRLLRLPDTSRNCPGHVPQAKRILRELRILRHLDHPNIIKIREVCRPRSSPGTACPPPPPHRAPLAPPSPPPALLPACLLAYSRMVHRSRNAQERNAQQGVATAVRVRRDGERRGEMGRYIRSRCCDRSPSPPSPTCGSSLTSSTSTCAS